MLPLLGMRMFVINFSVVVFPAPFGPIKPKTFPSSAEKEISSTTVFLWNCFVTCSTYNVPIDVDMNFDPNPILWTLENTLIPIRGHQTVPLL